MASRTLIAAAAVVLVLLAFGETVAGVLATLGAALAAVAIASTILVGLADRKTWATWKRLPFRPKGTSWAELFTFPLWLGTLPVIASGRGSLAIAIKLRDRLGAKSKEDTPS